MSWFADQSLEKLAFYLRAITLGSNYVFFCCWFRWGHALI